MDLDGTLGLLENLCPCCSVMFAGFSPSSASSKSYCISLGFTLPPVFEEAQHLADKLKKITVADLMEYGNTPQKGSDETDENISKSRHQHQEEDDNNDGADDGEGAEDFGLDAQKRKLQAFDEMDYEDGCEDEVRDGDLTDRDEVENNEENDVENGQYDALGVVDAIDEKSESPLEEAGDLPKPKSKEMNKSGATIKKKVRAQLVRKQTDRSIFVSANGFHFEVHFKFTDEPRILLAQIAQQTAQKVCMQRSGNVADCKQITCDKNQVLLYGKDPENKQSYSSK
ncbi:DNA-directed RNA polymerase I subunit 1-like [Pyrus x bretschneideri]|uniref:DNA-directed RNA polymerase I subunit 1-like n=1 Tax=Pyrus x bretschneideri TaxID=225117 RepID=UPI00202F6559|nr:DNA-directed RNA polymerase I subunit 1-like [Pyrus x bretschneideri]